ncbi:hypothetical protein BT63DRAFT_479302 [Microthyrium microscopicum]|uniref:Uncharacterized protein n=1 Tax=Microthyrium microscopicum TaxID=703497 RepID=A0A6A6UF18_9PEZI|nr:hypothetical protein BT63DRAFT_479302 [Microthyrium microscopicum]
MSQEMLPNSSTQAGPSSGDQFFFDHDLPIQQALEALTTREDYVAPSIARAPQPQEALILRMLPNEILSDILELAVAKEPWRPYVPTRRPRYPSEIFIHRPQPKACDCSQPTNDSLSTIALVCSQFCNLAQRILFHQLTLKLPFESIPTSRLDYPAFVHDKLKPQCQTVRLILQDRPWNWEHPEVGVDALAQFASSILASLTNVRCLHIENEICKLWEDGSSRLVQDQPDVILLKALMPVLRQFCHINHFSIHFRRNRECDAFLEIINEWISACRVTHFSSSTGGYTAGWTTRGDFSVPILTSIPLACDKNSIRFMSLKAYFPIDAFDANDFPNLERLLISWEFMQTQERSDSTSWRTPPTLEQLRDVDTLLGPKLQTLILDFDTQGHMYNWQRDNHVWVKLLGDTAIEQNKPLRDLKILWSPHRSEGPEFHFNRDLQLEIENYTLKSCNMPYPWDMIKELAIFWEHHITVRWNKPTISRRSFEFERDYFLKNYNERSGTNAWMIYIKDETNDGPIWEGLD